MRGSGILGLMRTAWLRIIVSSKDVPIFIPILANSALIPPQNRQRVADPGEGADLLHIIGNSGESGQLQSAKVWSLTP